MFTLTNQFKFGTTKDYKKFRIVKSNRDLNRGKIKKMIQSVKKDGLLIPIVVTKNFEVMEGQHRFAVCKNLNIDVPYIINNNLKKEHIITMNSVRYGWKISDYIHYWKTEGLQDYKDLSDQIDIWINKASLSTIVNCFTTTQTAQKDVKNGKYKFNYNLGNKILSDMLTLSKEFDSAFDARFVRVIKGLYIAHNFDIKRLIHNANKKKLRAYLNEKDTREGILEVYNYGISKKNRI
jgi:hypothetical protein